MVNSLEPRNGTGAEFHAEWHWMCLTCMTPTPGETDRSG